MLPSAPGARPPARPHLGALSLFRGSAGRAGGTLAATSSASHPPSRWFLPLPGVSCGANTPAEPVGGAAAPRASAHEWDSALSAPSRAWGGGGGAAAGGAPQARGSERPPAQQVGRVGSRPHLPPGPGP